MLQQFEKTVWNSLERLVVQFWCKFAGIRVDWRQTRMQRSASVLFARPAGRVILCPKERVGLTRAREQTNKDRELVPGELVRYEKEKSTCCNTRGEGDFDRPLPPHKSKQRSDFSLPAKL